MPLIEDFFAEKKTERFAIWEASARYRFIQDIVAFLDAITLHTPFPHQAKSHDGQTIPIPSLASSGLPPPDRYLTVELPAITLPTRIPSGKLN